MSVRIPVPAVGLAVARLLLGLALPAPSLAGDPHHEEVATPSGEWLARTWESDDGLPENSATAMVQTADHYLWFGTFNGLVRFDGVKFAVFDAANTPGLPHSGIVNLHLDRADRLWVSTLGGLVWREGTRWGVPPGVIPEKGDPVRTFAERPNGDVLLTTFGGRLLEFSGGSLRALPTPPGAGIGGYQGAYDESGNWWVTQYGFIGLWNGTSWERRADTGAFGFETFLACAPAREGGVWVVADREVRRYSRAGEVSRRAIPGLASSVWSLMEDSRRHLWICTISQGVFQLLPDGTVARWTEGGGIGYDGTRFAFEDREANLWIGTSGGGLTRLKQRRCVSFGAAQGLPERVVKSVAVASDGGVLLGTYGKGGFRLGRDGVTFAPLPAPLPAGRYVQSVLSDRLGRVWVGTYAGGLYLLDGTECRSIPFEQTGGDNVIALFEDRRGRVWVSGGKSVAVYDAGTFRAYGPESGLPTRGVRCFAEDREGTLWLSNYEGVFRMEGDRFVEVRAPGFGAFPGIAFIHATADGTLWLGSMSDGLYRWRQGEVARVNFALGLPVRGVYAILEDERGVFWMASGQGIVRVPRADLETVADGGQVPSLGQLLNRSDGLPSVDCSVGQQPIASRDGQGRFWFATMKGLAGVDPGRFVVNRVAPPTLVEELVYLRGTRPVVGRSEGERRLVAPFDPIVELPAGSRRLEIHYTAASFASPDKVRFQFRLEGGDDVWREAGGRRVAYLEDLAPGRYRFRVRAANNDGIWGAEAPALAFAILPHFWQTLWFRGLGILGLVGLAGFGVMRWNARLEGRRALQAAFTRQLLASQEAERSRLARELHDDVTQRLARLAIDAGQLRRGSGQGGVRQAIEEIHEGLIRLSEDVHALSYRLHPSILEDLGLVEALRAECERLMRRTELAVRIRVTGVPGTVPREPALCLFRVAEESLRNVVRHAEARNVEVSLRGLDGGLQLAVQDDGKGFDPRSRERRPTLGLTGMRERLALLGGQLDIESIPGQGAAVVAWLPLSPPTA